MVEYLRVSIRRKIEFTFILLNERVVDPLPLMTYGLKLSLKA